MKKAGKDLFVFIGKRTETGNDIHFLVREIDRVTGFSVLREDVGSKIFGDLVGISFVISEVCEDQVVQGDFIESRKEEKRIQVRRAVICLIIRISLSGYVQDLAHLILRKLVLFSQIS